MATKLYLRSTAASISRGTNTANLAGSNVWWRAKALSTTAGSAGDATFYSVDTVNGPTAGLEMLESGLTLEWISEPVSAGVTISGTVSYQVRGIQSNQAANATSRVWVYKLAATDFALTKILDTGVPGEWSTSAKTKTMSETPTSTALAKGDRIRVVVGADDDSTLVAGYTVSTYVDNADSTATYVSFNETFGFQTSDPSTQTHYLTATASDVATADVDYKIWTATS